MLQNSDLFLNAVEKDSLDLAFQSSGIDQCVCGNIFGPRIRRYYLIHFVLDGSGVLQIEGKKYPVKPGQAFLIPAGVNAAYQADFRHPWKYCWIGYQGTQASYYTSLLFGDGFVTDIQDITFYEKMIMKSLAFTDRRIPDGARFTPADFPLTFFSEAKTASGHLKLNGLLKEMFSSLVAEHHKDQEDISSAPYPKQIKAYIDRHYNEHMQIQDIADYLHLNPHYVTAVFKQKYFKTPKQYLTELRIEKAKIYLIDTDYSLQVIANAVGLENPFSFSRLFKSVTGYSPSEYKKRFPNWFSY